MALIRALSGSSGGGGGGDYEIEYVQTVLNAGTVVIATSKKAKGFCITSVSGWGSYSTWCCFDGTNAYEYANDGTPTSITATFNNNDITLNVTASSAFRYAGVVLY